MGINILLVDDHAIVREGIRPLLSGQPDFKIVCEAENGHQAVELANRLCPDVVVMDVEMPDLNGIDATQQITSHDPRIRVIVLSMYAHKKFVEKALHAGAWAYVTKSSSCDELTRAIHAVMKGQKYLSSVIAGTVVEGFVGHLPVNDRPAHDGLSDREREVLQLLAEGHTSRKIAVRLRISENTVEAHRRNISKKLDVHSVAELTKLAVREGLTSA